MDSGLRSGFAPEEAHPGMTIGNQCSALAAALRGGAMGNRRMQLLKLGFQMLVDQHQRFQRATDIAVAGRDDFVDRVIVDLNSCPDPPMYPVT